MMQARSAYLSDKYFFYALAIALVLHGMSFFSFNIFKAAPMVTVPVRALNLKLGEAEDAAIAEATAQAIKQVSDAQVEKAFNQQMAQQRSVTEDSTELNRTSIDRLTRASEREIKRIKSGEQSTPAEPLEKVVQQYVRAREFTPPAPGLTPSAGGSELGNSTAQDAEALRRYEQLISAWIQRYKVYPEEAFSQQVQGDGIMRIRIDRQGNIHYYVIEKSTGSMVLDRSMLDMIRRANPVPPVPDNYPEGQMREFLIPVNYRLN